jgi:hypothetical protein
MTNDEILMTNQCPSTNDQWCSIFCVIRHSVINSSFGFRHSSFIQRT